MSDDKNDILNNPDKGIGGARNVLARLFRQILRDMGIDQRHWHRLMLRYLNDPRNRIPPNGKDKSSARGNLNKELRRPTMTWKVFNDKAIPFLNPKRVEFDISMTWANGRTTHHKLGMDRSEMHLDEEIDADEDVDVSVNVGWGTGRTTVHQARVKGRDLTDPANTTDTEDEDEEEA